MPSAELWDLTFEELDALIDRRRFLDKRHEYQNLQIVCAVFNAQRTDKKQKVWKPEDFMDTGETKDKPEGPTRDPVFSALDAFAMARYGINNQGELEARIRIAKEKEEAEALAASVGADS